MREDLDSRRVVIVGEGGVVTPIGNDVPTFWNSLINGQSGIGFLPQEMRTLGVVSGAFVRDFNPEEYLDGSDLADISRAAQFANAVRMQALKAARFLNEDLSLKDVEPDRAGFIMGTGIGNAVHVGGMQRVLDAGRHLNRHDLFQIIPCRTALVSTMQKQDIEGPSFVVSNACASGFTAWIEAIRMIREGDADVVVAGGAEASLNKLTVESFAVIRALSTKPLPDWACRPFDQDGAVGFVLGEGAGAIVLESLDHVKKRGALHLVKGELLGYQQLSDGFCEDTQEDNIALGLGENYRRTPNTAPSLKGTVKVMTGALEKAGLAPEDIDCVVAHAPGPKIGSIVEATAIEKVFGNDIPVTAGKEYTGHMIAGDVARLSGVLKVLETGIIWPILHLEKPVRNLDFVVNEARRYQPGHIKTVMANEFGFGGGNTTLIIGQLNGI